MPLTLNHNHDWDLSVGEAAQIQQNLTGHVHLNDGFGEIHTVAGVDVGFENEGTVCRAAVVVLDFPGLTLKTHAIARTPCTFPYIPGYLSFREVPAILEALNALDDLPDILLCDGQGIAHPKRLGIASHIGVLTNIPSIGVAKSRLIGTYEEVPETKGSYTKLIDKGEHIGWVLRTRTNVKPLFISPGHRVSLETSRTLVMECLTKYRLPETTRWAHRLASGPLL